MNKVLMILACLICLSCNKMRSIHSKGNKDIGIEVVYGEDNRLEYYQILDLQWQSMMKASVALVSKRDMIQDPLTGNYQMETTPYGQSPLLCRDERFYGQPSGPFCSGFLVTPNIVVTAGHCIRSQYNCELAQFVFNYSYEDEFANPTQVSAEDVYNCDQVIHTQHNSVSGSDFAIIRLDRPVAGRAPMELRKQGRITAEDKLSVIGFPSGLPLKFADSGQVRDNSPEAFFVTTLDTYGGNSGSAVINSDTRLVEGILVRGEADFIYDPESKCRRSNVCTEQACRGEDVVRIEVIYEHLSPMDF